jgi:hypothetical protein
VSLLTCCISRRCLEKEGKGEITSCSQMLITAGTWKLDVNYEASYLILQRPDLYGTHQDSENPNGRKLELASYASTLSQQNYVVIYTGQILPNTTERQTYVRHTPLEPGEDGANAGAGIRTYKTRGCCS